jgi:hypothetical protein
MDVVLEYSRNEVSDIMVERINRCRLYLRAETMADIADADGKCLCTSAVSCHEGARVQTDELWPKQPRVGAVHKRAWKWFLRRLCKEGSKRWELCEPLGDWTTKPTEKGWAMYYDVNSDVMWGNMDNDGRWTEVSIARKARSKWELGSEGDSIENSELRQIGELIPVDVYRYESGQLITSVPVRWVRSGRTPEALGWSGWVARLPEAEKDLLRGCNEVYQTAEDQPLWEILQDEWCELVTVSDGSHRGKRGSFGWVMAVNKRIVWECRRKARGNPMTSYRAEAYGKASWLVFLREYAKCFRIGIKCKVRSYCDNLEVIKQTSFSARHEKAWECLPADYDVLKAIIAIQDELREVAPNMKQGIHVKGHQDRGKSINQLSWLAELNVEADKRASEAMAEMTSVERPLATLPWTHCPVYLVDREGAYTRGEAALLSWKWREREMLEYLSD